MLVVALLSVPTFSAAYRLGLAKAIKSTRSEWIELAQQAELAARNARRASRAGIRTLAPRSDLRVCRLSRFRQIACIASARRFGQFENRKSRPDWEEPN